jgi:hypothetical protein
MGRSGKAAELSEWYKTAERIEVGKNRLYWNQLVGLKFDKGKLAKLEAESIKHYENFVREFGSKPGTTFLIISREIALSKTFKLYMKLYDARTTKIVSKNHKFNGAPVNWGSWRQYAGGTDDSKARKELFDIFVHKTSILSPIIKARFDGVAKVMKELGTDPLENYLGIERIDLERLLTLVNNLGSGLKPAFRKTLDHYSREILGRDAEYFDDFYFFRSRVFRKYAKRFPSKVDPVSQIIKTMSEMGLDARKVKVDDKDRKGKSASAFCFSIDAPTDVRLSYRKSNPLEDFTGVFHEFGHGIHGCSILKDSSYDDKYGVPMGVAEIFSIFFEHLMHDRLYLKSKLGLSEAVATDLVERLRFNELFFATFYSANSNLKLRYWKDGLSIEAASKLYSDLTEKYMGMRYPGAYWLLHHVMPEYILYSPSYMLAAVRAMELRETLATKFGERYWEEKRSGKFLTELMSLGRSIELGRFSRLDEGPFVKSLVGA